MRCWSCSAEIEAGPTCPNCTMVQPLPPGIDRFRVLGLPKSYFLEAKAIEDRFRELNRQLHPDRFTQKSAKERRMSLEWTTAVNDAYRTLRAPLKRAAYLLSLHGIEVEKETGGSAMQQVPFEFLEEVMELREALADAKAEKDLTKVRALAKDVRARSGEVENRLRGLLEEWERSGEAGKLEEAGQALAVARYYERFLDEVDLIEMEALGGSV